MVDKSKVRFRVGDPVRTKHGRGHVLGCVSWKDSIRTMSDQEAKLFTQDIRSKYGDDFKSLWINVYVALAGGSSGWYEGRTLKRIDDE